jgi:hypothetical protein
MPEEAEEPPCELDAVRWYSVVKDGKVIFADNCIHDARAVARREEAELWRRGRSGYPSIRLPLSQ